MKSTFFVFIFLYCFHSFAQNINEIKLANEYYKQGEYEKALDIYIELSKKKKNIPLIHDYCFNSFVKTQSFKKAEKYLKRTIDFFPGKIYYEIDLARLYYEQKEDKKAEKYLLSILENIYKDPYLIDLAAQYVLEKKYPQWAEIIYLQARKKLKMPYLYAEHLMFIYQQTNQKERKIEEAMRFVRGMKDNDIEEIENTLQNALVEEGDLIAFEEKLYDEVQKSNADVTYNKLLIWALIQQKNFYAAFIQAKALDKRIKDQDCYYSMNVGIIALENNIYDDAIKIFQYIVDRCQDGNNYLWAREYLIKAREHKIKSTFPVNLDNIKALMNDYNKFIADVGLNSMTLDAYRNKALLHAFYLSEIDTAIIILTEVVNLSQNINIKLHAKAKLDLGDIYLLKGEYWESTLLYSQVEKSQKETSLGHEAKLKNAKLSYYKGDFELAQSHLDILKLATSREISNDAMFLSLLIKDNTALDSTDAVLKEYADIELLLFQNKKQKALESLENMLVKYPKHRIKDEVLWLQAKNFIEIGQFEKAVDKFQTIYQNFKEDILSDDAYFFLGKIYEENLNDKEKAMEIYQNFLIEFPGSIYSTEVRSRFRKLRGDHS